MRRPRKSKTQHHPKASSFPEPVLSAGGVLGARKQVNEPGKTHGAVLLVLLATFFCIWAAWEVAPELGGPGPTCDEWYHVYHGKRLVQALRRQGWEFFTPARIAENFPYGKPSDPPFHPPLGHWILGFWHGIFDFYPEDPTAVSVVSARLSGPILLAVLLLIVGMWVGKEEGWWAGVVAAFSTGVMPRLFGHAHLAGLDLLTATLCLASAAALVGAARSPLRAGRFCLAGAILGLAMLTRLHGILALVPAGMWLLFRFRSRAFLLGALWAGTGMAVFFLGWPWLWLNPFDHLKQFLVTSTARQPLHVFYLGRVWNDVDVPWHYPLVIFAVTVPLGLLLLGLLGVGVRLRKLGQEVGLKAVDTTREKNQEHSHYELMILLQIVFWLALFGWPGTPVYDGERLFLVLYPLWAFPVAWGTKFLYERLLDRGFRQELIGAGLAVLMAVQLGGNLLFRPVYLSYYNLLVGGLWGASRLGFEVNYWGDAVTQQTVEQACKALHLEQLAGQKTEVILFAPNLAPFQAIALNGVFPIEQMCSAEIIGYDSAWQKAPEGIHLAILYHRRADLHTLPQWLVEGEVLFEYSKQGVWLSRVVKVNPPEAKESPQRKENFSRTFGDQSPPPL